MQTNQMSKLAITFGRAFGQTRLPRDSDDRTFLKLAIYQLTLCSRSLGGHLRSDNTHRRYQSCLIFPATRGLLMTYRTFTLNRNIPPAPGFTGSLISQRSTNEPTSFCSVMKSAFTLLFADPGTYSNRVVRLSAIVTLPIS